MDLDKPVTRREMQEYIDQIMGKVLPFFDTDPDNAGGVFLNAAFRHISRFTAYTPIWRANSTNPNIGNGTLEGLYLEVGKIVVVLIFIKAGSTTTFGSSFWTVSLPFRAARQGRGLSGFGLMRCNDETSGSTQYLTAPYVHADGNYDRMVFDVASGSRANVAPNQPFTWANTDELGGFFIYERE